MAYKLILPSHAKIHPVFHVSLLKKALKPHQQPQPLPPMLNEELELEVTPEAILDSREDKQGYLEVLVKWKDLPQHECTWELAANIQDNFPDFQLEDKLVLLGGGSDKTNSPKPTIRNVYQRGNRRVWLKTS